MKPEEVFPTRLRELRLRYGLSQQDVSDYVGISRTYISDYERGKRLPSVSVLCKIAQCFGTGTSIDYLVGNEHENAKY